MSAEKTLSSLMSKLLTVAAFGGLIAGAVFTIKPNFQTVKVECLLPNQTHNGNSTRPYSFNMGVGPFNYYEVNASTIGSNGSGYQDTKTIVDIISNTKKNVSSYKDVRTIWSNSDQKTIFQGLEVTNQREVLNQIITIQDEFYKGVWILGISVLALILGIVWICINVHLDHKQRNKRMNRAREAAGENTSKYNRLSSIDDHVFRER